MTHFTKAEGLDFQKQPDHPAGNTTYVFNGDLTDPIECLQFSNEHIRVLHDEGIYTLDVLTSFTEERLAKLPNIGTLGASVIKETLARYNLAFQ